MSASFRDSLPSTCTDIDTFLRDEGFSCVENVTRDSNAWVYYFKELRKSCTNVMIRVVLRFELCVSDAPIGTYDENHDLFFNDAYLAIFDRQMRKDGFVMGRPFYDEETESLQRIADFPITPDEFADISKLCQLLA